MRAALLAVLLVSSSTLAFAQPAQPSTAGDDPHAGHVMEPAGDPPPTSGELPPFIPPLTDEDRRAAFPDVGSHHAAHDQRVHSFVLLDRLEWQNGSSGSPRSADADVTGWIGRDIDRVWFRADAHTDGSRIETARAHLLYGRRLFRWWDAVAGVRQDVGTGPARTWAAIGLQGLAPYWFEVEATFYVGAGGRTQARFEAEYDLRITNRLLLQPIVKAQITGMPDSENLVGAGLSTTETGLRLRYLVRREFAPYIGIAWNRSHGATADLVRDAGNAVATTRLVAGVRAWF